MKSPQLRRSCTALSNFDREYYRRFYNNPETAVASRAEMVARARFISAYTQHVGLPVHRLLDLGCGMGLMRASFRRFLPLTQYVGVEHSDYLCERYGWVRGDAASFKATKPFELVVCYDVLQYLSDIAAARAVANLARLCRGVLYISALTTEDWRYNCDRARTDSDVYLRSGEWYRRRLRRHFRMIGAGLWIRRNAPLITWEMEAADPRTAP